MSDASPPTPPVSPAKRPDATSSTASAKSEPAKKRSWLRRLVSVAVLLVLLLVLVVALLPTLASWGPIERFVVSQIDAASPGTVEIDDLELGWFSSPRLVGVRYVDEQESLHAKVSSVTVQGRTLWALATGDSIGELLVEQVEIEYDPARKTEAPVDDAPPSDPGPSEPTEQAEPFEFPARLAGKFIVRDFTASIAQPEGQAPSLVTLPTFELDASNPQAISLKADGKIMHHGEQGRLDVRLSVKDLFDAERRLKPMAAVPTGHATLSAVPMALLVQLGLPEWSAEAFGPQLDARFAIDGKASKPEGTLSVVTEHLELALQYAADDTVLKLQPEKSIMVWHVTPAGFAAMTADAESDGSETAQLAQGFDIALQVKRFGIPVDNAQPDPSLASLLLAVTVEDSGVTLPDGRRVAWSGLRGEVRSDQLADRLSADISGNALAGGSSEPMSLKAEIADPLGEPALNVRGEALPLRLVAAMGLIDDAQLEALGDQLDLKLSWSPGGDASALSASFEASTPKLDVTGSARVDGNRLPVDAKLTFPGSESGEAVTINAALLDVHDAQGALALGEADLELDIAGSMPTELLAALAEDPRLVKILGPKITIEHFSATQSAEGILEVDGKITSPTSMVALRPVVTKKQVLTLAGPLEAQLELSPDVADGLLKWINPLLVDAETSDRPAVLKVDQALRVPLKGGIDPATVEASGTLDLGKVKFGEQGAVGFLWSYLRKSGVTSQTDTEAGFEPVAFTMKDGVLKYSDGSLTLGNIQLRFGGSVNVISEKITATITIPAASLRKIVPEVGDRLKDGDAITIPLGGTIERPQLDRTAFVREMTKLTAKAAVGGELRDLIKKQGGSDKEADAAGQLLDQILKGGDKSKTPDDSDKGGEATDQDGEASGEQSKQPADPAEELLKGVLGELLKEKKKDKAEPVDEE